MIVGGYTLHLYCDDPDHHGHNLESGRHIVLVDGEYKELKDEFAGHNERNTMRQAREYGWKFTKDRRAFCPFCRDSQ